MTCKKCEEAMNKSDRVFYKWKDAIVEIVACDKHWDEIREALNKIQKEDKKRKKRGCSSGVRAPVL